jgi:ABC-type antimicrobial peptide transport system permease subunit
MGFVEIIRSALWGIFTRPGPSFSLIATMASGLTAILVVVSVMLGFSAEIERLSYGIYGRAVVVRENMMVFDHHDAPKLRDAKYLKTRISKIQKTIAWRKANIEVQVRSKLYNFYIYGVEGDYQIEASMPISYGRALTVAETRSRKRLCMLGAGAAETMGFKKEKLNSQIRLGGMSCKVIGVFAASDEAPAQRFGSGIIAPFRAVTIYFEANKKYTYKSPTETDWLTLIVKEQKDVDEVRRLTDISLRRYNGIPHSHVDPYKFGDEDAPVNAMMRQRVMLSSLLLIILSAAVLAAMIGYSGGMFSSVLARRREIAIRLTIGAVKKDIIMQFLTESIFLGLLGAVLGAGISYCLTEFIAYYGSWPVEFSWVTLVVSLGLGVIMGAIFGVAPARRAATLAPALAVKR